MLEREGLDFFMYNEKRIQILKKAILIGVAAISIVFGFVLGQASPNMKENSEETKKAEKIEQQIQEMSDEKLLETEDVETFLIAYFTKRDLGENRNRYKPLMTEAMYKQETSNEDLPINQAYKGYVINQVFDNATIYIDPLESVAIAQVQYHNTQLLEKGTTKGALIDNKEEETLKITFTKQGDKYLVHAIESVLLTSTGVRSSSNTYEEVEYPEESTFTDEKQTDKKTSDSTENQSTKESVERNEQLEGSVQ
ncbi:MULTISPECIES: hypothetical protein [unclassified Enterococcus]|uniref:hypothetical protein n=1 Tax=unclassified Enterococcus TaxID=2608891 RepID=UPI00197EC172|nr:MULTISPECIES: hypothetical protein [unclassified Enterococcus]